MTLLVGHLERYPIRRFTVSRCERVMRGMFLHLVFDEVLCEGKGEDWEETLMLVFGRMRAKKVSFT